VDLDAFQQELVGQAHLLQRFDRLWLQCVGAARYRTIRPIVNDDDVDPEPH
jgi:hypothetical protein